MPFSRQSSPAVTVVRRAPCPVLTVCPMIIEAGDMLGDIKNILCPTDFSEPSFNALPLAGELAAHFRAQLQIVHVLEPLAPVLGVVSIDDFQRARSGDAALSLLDVIQKEVPLEAQESARLNRVVRVGSPAEQIVSAARDGAADLIVMATQGQTGWRHLVFGSVAEEVVRSAPCPVLTINESRK